MKNIKRITKVLTMVLCIGVLLTTTGCGKEKTTAAESAQIFFDLMIKQDTTNVEKFGMTEESAKSLLEEEKTATKTATRLNFTKSGFTISNEKLDAIVEAQYKGMKLLSATTEITSESGKDATVIVKNTYIDFTGIDTKAASDAQATVIALGLTSETEALEKLKDQYIENLIAGLNNAQPSTETNQATYQFTKDSGEWIPAMDSEEFGKQLGTLAMKKQ